MAGLPTETDDDIEATAELLLALKRDTKGLRLTLISFHILPNKQLMNILLQAMSQFH